MATVLFAWELGGGLGHVTQIAPLAVGLAERGHRVYAALRDLSSASSVFGRSGVQFLPAPHRTRRPDPVFRRTLNFAHILHNVGFGDADSLAAHASAWRNLYRLTRPDLIFFDHSPTALLASHGAPATRVVIGSGFCVPPAAHPMPPLAELRPEQTEQLRAEEARLLTIANRLLSQWGQQTLDYLGQLYARVDAAYLTTFREFDHYPHREMGEYFGPVIAGGGVAPTWPETPGKRVYAYLKPFPALPGLLSHLVDRRLPTVVYPDGVPLELQKHFACDTLRFEQKRVDLSVALRRCDVAITNGNHGSTAAAVMAGKPVLTIPLVLEQLVLARAMKRLGASLVASPKQAGLVAARLDELLDSPAYALSAVRLAKRFTPADLTALRTKMLGRTEDLLNTRVERNTSIA